jgi:hypothetical protein
MGPDNGTEGTLNFRDTGTCLGNDPQKKDGRTTTRLDPVNRHRHRTGHGPDRRALAASQIAVLAAAIRPADANQIEQHLA